MFSNVIFSIIYVNIISNLNVSVCTTLASLWIPLLRPYRTGLLATLTVALACNVYPHFLRNLSGHYRVLNIMSLGPLAGPEECNPCSLAPKPPTLTILSPSKLCRVVRVVSAVHLFQPKPWRRPFLSLSCFKHVLLSWGPSLLLESGLFTLGLGF